VLLAYLVHESVFKVIKVFLFVAGVVLVGVLVVVPMWVFALFADVLGRRTDHSSQVIGMIRDAVGLLRHENWQELERSGRADAIRNVIALVALIIACLTVVT
jgi:hypothetical protein